MGMSSWRPTHTHLTRLFTQDCPISISFRKNLGQNNLFQVLHSPSLCLNLKNVCVPSLSASSWIRACVYVRTPARDHTRDRHAQKRLLITVPCGVYSGGAPVQLGPQQVHNRLPLRIHTEKPQSSVDSFPRLRPACWNLFRVEHNPGRESPLLPTRFENQVGVHVFKFHVLHFF